MVNKLSTGFKLIHEALLVGIFFGTARLTFDKNAFLTAYHQNIAIAALFVTRACIRIRFDITIIRTFEVFVAV